jgi:uncharacterized DUF497 family protein
MSEWPRSKINWRWQNSRYKLIALSVLTIRRKPTIKLQKSAFDRAAPIFLDRSALSEFDEAHSEAEERWITSGLDHIGVVLVVCHTFRDDTEPKSSELLVRMAKT